MRICCCFCLVAEIISRKNRRSFDSRIALAQDDIFWGAAFGTAEAAPFRLSAGYGGL
jgi:hypothetical protein